MLGRSPALAAPCSCGAVSTAVRRELRTKDLSVKFSTEQSLRRCNNLLSSRQTEFDAVAHSIKSEIEQCAQQGSGRRGLRKCARDAGRRKGDDPS
jgi:hypothetical protein